MEKRDFRVKKTAKTVASLKKTCGMRTLTLFFNFYFQHRMMWLNRPRIALIKRIKIRGFREIRVFSSAFCEKGPKKVEGKKEKRNY